MNIFTAIVATSFVFGAHELPTSRIVGGHDAPDGAYPYMVSIQYEGDHQCGGSILNEYFILTAAHCIFEIEKSDLQILVGTNSLTGRGQKYEVEELIVHEEYTIYELLYDVGLIKLKTSLIFNEKIRPIELASKRESETDSFPVVLTGWGVLDSMDPEPPNILQVINLIVIDHVTCKDISFFLIKESQICSLTKKGEGACFGDSGGPLVASNGKQVGIVSFGAPCAIGQPDIYTRVSYFHDWIQESMQ